MESFNYNNSYNKLIKLGNDCPVEEYWTIVNSCNLLDIIDHTIYGVFLDYYGDECSRESREVINTANIYLYSTEEKKHEIFNYVGYRPIEPIKRSQLLDWLSEGLSGKQHNQIITINTSINDTVGKFITALVHEYVIEFMSKKNNKESLNRRVGFALYEYDAYSDGYYKTNSYNTEFEDACTNYDTLKISEKVKEALGIDEEEVLDTYKKDVDILSCLMDNEEARKKFNLARLNHLDLYKVNDLYNKLFNYYKYYLAYKDEVDQDKFYSRLETLRDEVNKEFGKPKMLVKKINDNKN